MIARPHRRGPLRYLLPLLLLLVAPLQAAEPPQETLDTLDAFAGSAIDRRLKLEELTRDNPFVITPHKPTYILPIAYDSRPNGQPYGVADSELQHVEIKFQFSFKLNLGKGLFAGHGDLDFGYTQQSFWQAYNEVHSSPFRDTNYEPEFMLTFKPEYRLFGFTNRLLILGAVHQSNGESDPQSRSWNRLYAQLLMERGPHYIGFKPWWRLPESAESDNNRDIGDYLGNFELRYLYLTGGNHSLGFMVRNNLDRDNRGAIQVDYTFPLFKRLRGYLQLFNGYGESLIDYDHYSNSLGVGVMLVDWL